MTPEPQRDNVICITSGRRRRPQPQEPMPVNRANFAPFAVSDSSQFQAFTDLANFADALERAAGVRIGANGASNTPAPAPATWTVSALNGHFVVQVTDQPSSATQPPVQHQIASSTSINFDNLAGITTYTLGLGETTRDIVDPGVTKYWRLQSRYPGSAWNGWRLYATSSGVAALSSGPLKTA